MSILISSAGRRVGLLQAFRRAADRLGIGLEIIACDLAPRDSAACAIADQSHSVPRCDDPGYAAAIVDLVRQHGVRLVVPTIDPELLPLARAVDRIERDGARLHVSGVEVIKVVRDKRRTAEVLGAAGLPVPETLTHAEFLTNPEHLGWPVFAKPSGGSASRGLHVYRRLEDVPAAFPEDMVFQRFLTGPEFTINMFVDAGGVLRMAIPHRRMSIRAGEVEKGVTVRRDDLHRIAQGIVTALPGLRGLACYQVIDDPAQGPCVIEINARFGGGYPLADHAGATCAQWLLEEVSGLPCSAHDNWREGVKMLRYDSAVYQG